MSKRKAALATPISATAARFIKLGIKGKFERDALREGRLYIGYHDAPHTDCLAERWDEIAAIYLAQGHKPFVASNHRGQIQKFYTEPATCLWITFVDGCMWWAFADPEVTMCIEENWRDIPPVDRKPSRYRRCIGGWRNTSIGGNELLIHAMPGYITQTAGYRGTICDVNDKAIVRLINDEVDPNVKAATEARDALIVSIGEVIDRLFWKDFETLIDLIFQRSGWPRVTSVGGTQKLFEFELENPVTNERSFVQVKAQTNQKTLQDYIEKFDLNPAYKQMFFVCHTIRQELNSDRDDVIIWTRPKVAEMVVKTGLTDWVLEKA